MNKIIATFDGFEFSESTLKHTLSFAKQAHAYLVGVFLDDLMYHTYKFADLVDDEGGVSDKKIQYYKDQDEDVRMHSVQLFQEACEKEGVNFTIHRDRNVALQELLQESIYSDLLIINSKETFSKNEEQIPTTFLQDLLSDVMCPVLVVPKQYKPIEKVILLYDGDPSSVYAIKMFDYLLPNMKSQRVEVVTVKSKNDDAMVPDKRLMKEFTKRHYPLAEYTVLQGDVEEEVVAYLKDQAEHALVVLGAYRRGRVSRWFKESMADTLMKNVAMPLFIAHN